MNDNKENKDLWTNAKINCLLALLEKEMMFLLNQGWNFPCFQTVPLLFPQQPQTDTRRETFLPLYCQ